MPSRLTLCSGLSWHVAESGWLQHSAASVPLQVASPIFSKLVIPPLTDHLTRCVSALQGPGSLHPVLALGWKPLCEVHCNGLVGKFLGGHDRCSLPKPQPCLHGVLRRWLLPKASGRRSQHMCFCKVSKLLGCPAACWRSLPCDRPLTGPAAGTCTSSAHPETLQMRLWWTSARAAASSAARSLRSALGGSSARSGRRGGHPYLAAAACMLDTSCALSAARLWL